MENPIKMDDLGVPSFFGNTHMIASKNVKDHDCEYDHFHMFLYSELSIQ